LFDLYENSQGGYKNYTAYELAIHIARIFYIPIIFVGFMQSATLIYQSTERPIQNLLTSSMQSIIVFIPTIFIIQSFANGDPLLVI
jgi:Na+-driven multidrug efflux pump